MKKSNRAVIHHECNAAFLTFYVVANGWRLDSYTEHLLCCVASNEAIVQRILGIAEKVRMDGYRPELSVILRDMPEVAEAWDAATAGRSGLK